jgi:hypothetical protein
MPREGQEKRKRGRPRSEKPGPDAYNSADYKVFLANLDSNESELSILREDRRELVKAEVERNLNRKAHAFVQSLWLAVQSEKMTLQDAIATLDCVPVYAEWRGLFDQGDMLRPASNVSQMTRKEPAEASAA